MAEYLLRLKFKEIGCWHGEIHSAGVSALVNQSADATTMAMMLRRGIAIDSHRAKQLTIQHLRQADLILVMQKRHRNEVLELDPTVRGKTFLLGHWRNAEIPDPFQRGEMTYIQSLRLIDFCIQPWIEKIVHSSCI